ncbi:TPA: hypothetical protein N0F65_005284, partial [Lagenidium giganteum]
CTRPLRVIESDHVCQDAFARKWKKFTTDGIDKLLVITDFDYTLTPFTNPDGQRGSSSHGVLTHCSVMDPSVPALGRELFLHYYPIEQSATLTNEEKLPFLMTREMIRQAVEENGVHFRSGFHEIFRVLADANVPTLLFSAGLYDVIHEILDQEYAKTTHSKPPSNVHVVGNMMQFDENGKCVGFDGKLIHSLNKNASVLLDTPFWHHCQMERRHNILLLGDSLGDANMAKGLDYTEDEIIRIGVLNSYVPERLQDYLDTFDVVLTNDASLHAVELLLHQVQMVPPASK